MTYEEQYARYRQMTEETLDALLSDGAFARIPSKLLQSMRYSALAGGKRIRPVLLLATTEMLSGPLDEARVPAAALEMIHTYSLIHDDLPGMDNDTLRRGRPTNHVVFGEGQAILAGDGLLNCAFETMLDAAADRPDRALECLLAMREIATGAGVTGMIAGQVMDLYCEANNIGDVNALQYIQRNKTACMFIYPLRAAARLCGAGDAALESLTDYGRAFGLLFQATDDLLDVTGDPEKMGKTLGKDAESGKLTCISAYGLEGTRALVEKLHREALRALEPFGEWAAFFASLVDSMVDRTK